MIILTWIMAALLVANSLVILVNIFNYPPSGMRLGLSFIAAAGLVAGLIYLAVRLSQLFGPFRRVK